MNVRIAPWSLNQTSAVLQIHVNRKNFLYLTPIESKLFQLVILLSFVEICLSNIYLTYTSFS